MEKPELLNDPQGELLYKEFCNFVCLGQWELSRACIFSVQKSKSREKKFKQKLKESLIKISRNPSIVKTAWIAFSSPTYISLLATQMLVKIADEKEEDEICSLKNLAEFCIMLEELFPKLPESEMKGLTQIFVNSAQETCEPGTFLKEVDASAFREETLQLIKWRLFGNPPVISVFLNQLGVLSRTKFYIQFKEKICSTYFLNLFHCLEQLKPSLSACNLSTFEEYKLKFHSYLSLIPECIFDPHASNNSKKCLDEILHMIVSLCDSAILQIDQVYQAILTRSSPTFMLYFCGKEDECFHHMLNTSALPCNISSLIINEGIVKLREILLLSLRRSEHFLGIFVDFSVMQILAGQFSQVQKFLCNLSLGRLLPLVLILSWHSCCDDESLANVMQVVKMWKHEEKNDVLLAETCNKFLSSVTFKESSIEYFMKKYPEISVKDITIKGQTVFNQLQTHTPLAVIQRTFGLKHVEPLQVLKLLHSFIPDAETSLHNKSLAFCAVRDQTIFHGYLAIYLVMEAILFCCELNQILVKQDHVSLDMRYENVDSSKSEVTTHDISWKHSIKKYFTDYGMQASYTKYVAERLKLAKEQIKQIYPLTFRTEILENIFSLLFLSLSDMRDMSVSFLDSDEGYENDEHGGVIKHMQWSIYDYNQVPLISRTNDQPEIKERQFTGRFVVSKIKPKDIFCDKKRFLGTQSNKISSRLVSKTEFLCCEIMVRDLLSVLKDAILGVEAEFYTNRGDTLAVDGQKEHIVESISNSQGISFAIKTDVNYQELQKRLSALRQYVDEANWRYDLVKTNFIEKLILQESTAVNRSKNFRVCQNDVIASSFQDDAMKSSKSASDIGSSNLSSTDNFDSTYTEIRSRRKKRKRKKIFRRLASIGGNSFSEPSIIQRMLSSPNALLRYCLWRQNFDKAVQVIDLCQLQSSLESKELMFTKELDTVCLKIKKTLKSVEKFPQNVSELERPATVPHIAAVAKAAALGLQSTAASSVLDQEIDQKRIPPISDLTEKIFSLSQFDQHTLAGSLNLYSSVLADLSFTRGFSLSHSMILLNMSIRNWTTNVYNQDSMSLKKSSSFIQGNFKTTQTFISLTNDFYLFDTNAETKETLGDIFFPHNYDLKSLSFCLQKYVGQFDSVLFGKHLKLWNFFCSCLETFINLLHSDENTDISPYNDADTNFNPKNKLHTLYKKLLKSTMDLCSWSTETIRPHSSRYINYMNKLYVYLQQVTGALLGCKDQNVGLGLTSYTSYFSSLKESPTEILRKMVVQNKIPPQKIERFASCMKVDLGHVLVDACFPTVCVNFEKDYSSLCSDFNYKETQMYVLNKSARQWSSPGHPDTVARTLMTALIEMLQDIAISKDNIGITTIEDLKSLLKHSKFESWVNDCSELAHVDLNLLKEKKETTAFFINVTNVAWTHALLFDVSVLVQNENMTKNVLNCQAVKKNQNSQFRVPMISPFFTERLMRQKLIGYSIGQLGDISLFDLRYHILHLHLPAPKHLAALPYNVLLSNPSDLNPVWLKYAPPVENKLLFVLCEGMQFSTKLEIMFSDHIYEQLNKAMEEYLNFHVIVDVDNRKIELPKLLEFYLFDFVEDKVDSSTMFEGLLILISSFMRPDVAASIKQLLSLESSAVLEEEEVPEKKKLSVEVQFRSLCLSPCLLLQYPDARNISDNLDVSEILLHPEPVILEFLKKRCSIISNLYNFITDEVEAKPENSVEVIIEDESEMSNCSQATICKIDSIAGEFPTVQLLKKRKDLVKESCIYNDSSFEWFISALSPIPKKDFILTEIENYFLNQQWDRALYCIDVYSDLKNKPDFCLLAIRQMLLQYMARLEPNPVHNICDPWSYSLCMQDSICCAFIILENVQRWPYPSAVQSLKYCLSNHLVKSNKELASRLQLKLKEIEIYQKIFEASKSVGNVEGESCSFMFNNWQDISEYSIWDQSVVVDCIKSSGLYNLSVDWAKHHVIDSRLKMNILVMQIVWHLNAKPLQGDEVSVILESCTPSECVELGNIVLPDLSTSESKLHFVQLMLNMPIEQKDQVHYTNMMFGLKMLDSTKHAIKEHYYDLVAYPDLILEQLLLNMEITDVERAIQSVLEDIQMEKFMNVHISVLSINQLLEDYAFKSLELPIIDDSNVSSTSNTTILDSGEIECTVEQFVMPSCVPSKDEWIPDSRVYVCQVCSEEPFNMFSRRHHCRRCGRVVCANCSQNTLLVQGYGNSEVRVCDNCYNQTVYNTMTGSISSPFKSSSFDKRYRVLSSMKSQNVRNSPSLPVYDYLDLKRRTSSIGNSDLFHWTFTTDHEQNEVLRTQFSYDSAPSVSLCLSILKLHSNPAQCAKFMLTLCDQLINKIKPKPSGKLNKEVDFYLIISMIKSLLVNSRVKYHELQDFSGEEVIDAYFRQLDVIKMLVNANCLHQIPRENLLSIEIVGKLRDHLLEEERMALALEVSTNCSLDKQSVWARWGLFCLYAGDWATAREKFCKCLNVLKDRGKQAQESSILKSIINYLESSQCVGAEKASAVFKDISVLEQIQNGKIEISSDTGFFDEKIKEECLYYLNVYGSHFSTVSFYQRHGLLNEALAYILNQKCNPEVFTTALLMPTLKCAQLSTLQHLLTFNDCTLAKWWPYLIHSCRHLQHLGYMNVLYHMQLFMEDYIRAAKSSINFYLAPAISYVALFERYHFLRNARKHFETYIKKQNESHQATYMIQSRNFLTLPIEEVKSYIKTIKLQEEVSNFFQLCDTRSVQTLIYDTNPSAFLNSTSVSCPPTLFGNKSEKNEIATLVLVNATKIDEGFDLAAKIVKECGLNVSSVVCAAGQELINRQWNDQIQHFLHNIKCCFVDSVNTDEVIMECITCLVQQNGDVEYLIKLLSSDSNKINAYLMSSKLKNAYLLAIKLHRPLDVHRIMIAAERSGQDAVKNFCEKWLQANAQKSKLRA